MKKDPARLLQVEGLTISRKDWKTDFLSVVRVAQKICPSGKPLTLGQSLLIFSAVGVGGLVVILQGLSRCPSNRRLG